MPNRLITYLGFSCGTLFAAYAALLIATIFFATWQTGLAASMRESEARVMALETEYYEAIAQLNATDVSAIGFYTPSKTEYVAEAGSPTFTLAETKTVGR